MDKNQTFPVYARSLTCLYAFVAKDKCYVIHMGGSNTNPGCTVDHYITRKMALKHWGVGQIITEQRFTELYNKLFSSMLMKITSHEELR